MREPRKDDNRPKKRHIFLRIDSWIDSTVWNAGFKLGQWWEDTTIFFRRFRVTGWKKAVFEVLGEGMNWGTVGSVLMLALAEILARSGERIGCPGIMEPVSARNAAERLATAIMLSPLAEGLPETGMIRSASDLVLIGDFLDPAEKIMDRLGPLARRGLRGHVVEIADPAEEVFPYSGRTEFTDPETGEKLTAGRAEVLREDYQRAYIGRRDTLGVTLRHLGWTFTPHKTDRPASEALVAVHTYLSGMPGRATHGGQL